MRERSRSRAELGALAAALVIVLAIAGVHIDRYRQISPIDELQHIDAVDKAPHVIRRGELVGETALREEACRGIDAAFVPPRCDTPGALVPGDFQEQGYNTTYIHPPLFYSATKLVASGIDVLPGVNGIVTAARLADALWLALGLVLVAMLLRQAGVTALGQFGLLTLLGTTPLVLHASTTVNPDALAVAAGALVLLALGRWERWLDEGGPSWVPLLVPASAVVAVSFKFTHVAGVALVLLVVAVRALYEPEHRRRRLVMIAAVGGAVLLTQLAWSSLQNALALVSRDDIPMVRNNQVESFELLWIARELHTMVTPLRTPYLPAMLRRSTIALSTQVLDLLALAGVASAAVYCRPRARERQFALATACALVSAGPVMVLAFYVSSRLGSEVPSRYGLSLLPGLAVCAAPGLRARRHDAVLAGFAALVALVTFAAVL